MKKKRDSETNIIIVYFTVLWHDKQMFERDMGNPTHDTKRIPSASVVKPTVEYHGGSNLKQTVLC